MEKASCRVIGVRGVNGPLLSEVEKFLRSMNVAPARFGREVMGDPRFVFDLRNEREPRERTVTRVCNFLTKAIN